MLDEKTIGTKISNTSIFELEREITEYPETLYKVIKASAEANREESEAELNLEIVIADIVKEICEEGERQGKSIPPSAISEVRRTKVPLDMRYRRMKKRLIEKKENADKLRGLVRSWETRGYRLMELTKLADRLLWDEPRVYKKEESFDKNIEDAGSKLEY